MILAQNTSPLYASIFDGPRNYDDTDIDISKPDSVIGSKFDKENNKCITGSIEEWDPIKAVKTKRDFNWDMGNAYCISYASSLGSAAVAGSVAIKLACRQTVTEGPPPIPISPVSWVAYYITGSLKCAEACAKATAEAAAASPTAANSAQICSSCCATTLGYYAVTVLPSIAVLAATRAIAGKESKSVKICGSDWLSWKHKDNDGSVAYIGFEHAENDSGKYRNCINYLFQNSASFTDESCLEHIGATSEDLNIIDKKVIGNKYYREYLYGGIEYIDNSSSSCDNPFHSSEDDDDDHEFFKNTFGYEEGNKKKQRYYLTGSASHNKHANNYACYRFRPADRTLRDKTEMKEAYECCLKKSRETLCIEKSKSNYKFCHIGEKCKLGDLTYQIYNAKGEDHAGYICAKSYSACPFNFPVGFGSETKLYKDDSESRNRIVNFCQYLNHCVKTSYTTPNFEIEFSDKSGSYISKACRDLRGDSQNIASYELQILSKKSQHFSAPIAQCFKETITNFLLNRAAESKCKMVNGVQQYPDKDDKCKDDEYIYKKGDLLDGTYEDGTYKSILQTIKDYLLLTIKIAMILAVVIFGVKLLISPSESLKRSVIFSFLLKFIVVMYFVLGTAWQEFLIEGVINTSTELSEMTFIPYKDKILENKKSRKSLSNKALQEFDKKLDDQRSKRSDIIRARLDLEDKKKAIEQEIKNKESTLPLYRSNLEAIKKIKEAEEKKITGLKNAYQQITDKISNLGKDIQTHKSKKSEFVDLSERYGGIIDNLESEITTSEENKRNSESAISSLIASTRQKIESAKQSLKQDIDNKLSEIKGDISQMEETIIPELEDFVSDFNNFNIDTTSLQNNIDKLSEIEDISFPDFSDESLESLTLIDSSLLALNSQNTELANSLDGISSYATSIKSDKESIASKSQQISENQEIIDSKEREIESGKTGLETAKSQILAKIAENYPLLAPLDDSIISDLESINIEADLSPQEIILPISNFIEDDFKTLLNNKESCFITYVSANCPVNYNTPISDLEESISSIEQEISCLKDNGLPTCQNEDSTTSLTAQIDSEQIKIKEISAQIDIEQQKRLQLETAYDQAQLQIMARRTDLKLDSCQFPRYNYLSPQEEKPNNYKYPPGTSYLKVWDTLDCKIAKAFGLTPNVSVPNILLIMLAALFTGGLGVIFFVGAFIFAFFLIALTLRALHIFIMSVIIIAILIYISPITIICILFDKTKSIFDKWSRTLTATSLQPIILFAYIGLMISIFDYLVIGDAQIIQKDDNPRDITLTCTTKDGEKVNNSIYCTFKVAELSKLSSKGFEALGLGIPILLDLNKDRIFHVAKSALLIYIFAKLMDNISTFSSRLIGGVQAQPSTPGAGAMTSASYKTARAIQKRGTRVMKKIGRKGMDTAKKYNKDTSSVNNNKYGEQKSGADVTASSNPPGGGAGGNNSSSA